MVELELQNPVLESEGFMSCQGGVDGEKQEGRSQGTLGRRIEKRRTLRRIGRVVTGLDKLAGGHG